MARRGRHPRGGRVTPKGTRPPGYAPSHRSDEDDEPELVRQIRTALADPHPLQMLELTSSLLALADTRDHDPFDRDATPRTSRATLVQTFLDVPRGETSALLAVIAALSTDEDERGVIADELERRRMRVPAWIGALPRAEARRAVEMGHVFGDGEELVVGVRLAGGHELTAVVRIGHNVGTKVRDGFVLGEPIDVVLSVMEGAADADTSFTDLSLADARARIEEGIERSSITWPRIETESWPASRALIEWMARLLPTGGTGYAWPEWSPEEREAFLRGFMASPVVEGLDPEVDRELADHLVWFGCDYGNGDPLRMSPALVEILLVDWVPRKIVAGPTRLARVPDVLRRFIRYGHAERGIRAELTEETLDAVDDWEPEYQELIRTPRPQGVDAILAATGALDPDGPWELPPDDLEHEVEPSPEGDARPGGSAEPSP